VFQQYHLIPYLTVLENVLTPDLALRRADSQKRTVELLGNFGLRHRTNHLPAELSAGEKQRVALARAMVSEPAILFADEVTGNLDEANAAIVLACVRGFAEKGGSVLMATHDRQAALQADRLVSLMENS